MKNIVPLIVLTVLGAAIFVGCNKNMSDSNSSPTNEPPSSTVTNSPMDTTNTSSDAGVTNVPASQGDSNSPAGTNSNG
jgi:hypothetical protein